MLSNADAPRRHTFLDGEEAVDGELAVGWGRVFSQELEDATHVLHPSVPWSAGAMVSDTEDMVRWAQALYGGGLLSDALTEMQVEAAVDTGLAGIRYGLGVMLRSRQDLGEVWGHDGGIPGFIAVMQYAPKLDAAAAAVVTNEDLSEMLIDLVDDSLLIVANSSARAGDRAGPDESGPE